MHGIGRLIAGALLLLCTGSLALWYFRETPPPPSPPSPPESPATPERADLSSQIQSFCGQACHAYPSPDTFPRRYWRKEVEQAYRFFEQSTLALQPPPIDEVVRYYEQRAPEELPPPRLPEAAPSLNLRLVPQSYPGPPAFKTFAISHVQIIPDDLLPGLPPAPAAPATSELSRRPHAILACDMLNGLILLLRLSDPRPTWKILARVKNPALCRVLDLDGDGLQDLLVADLGNFLPTDLPCGQVVWLRGQHDGSFHPHTLLSGVGRVADVTAADFRGVGKRDLVVGAFGWRTTGSLLYLRNETVDWKAPRFVSRVLDSRHGAIHVPVADLDGDGRPDFVALFSQEHESIVGFFNDGKGAFRKQPLYDAPHPAYGSSGIQLVDLNVDGQLDILYTNGDVLDSPYLLKPYHGVQWLENLGASRFRHHPLSPMYGAHRALAGDLFATGRPAVVAVSFLPASNFPDRALRKPDSILLLEQTAPGRFRRHVLEHTDCDHVTCAIGDLFASGRQDLVVGNFSPNLPLPPVVLWRNLGPASAPRQRSASP